MREKIFHIGLREAVITFTTQAGGVLESGTIGTVDLTDEILFSVEIEVVDGQLAAGGILQYGDVTAFRFMTSVSGVFEIDNFEILDNLLRVDDAVLRAGNLFSLIGAGNENLIYAGETNEIVGGLANGSAFSSFFDGVTFTTDGEVASLVLLNNGNFSQATFNGLQGINVALVDRDITTVTVAVNAAAVLEPPLIFY